MKRVLLVLLLTILPLCYHGHRTFNQNGKTNVGETKTMNPSLANLGYYGTQISPLATQLSNSAFDAINNASGAPTADTSGTTTNNSGTGGYATSGSTTPAYTTYQQSILNALPGQLSTVQNSAQDAANTSARSYQNSILDYLDKLRLQQSGIDQQGVQNELSRKQGTQGVLGMVGRGIQSGGVLLANKNAGSSSASGALARAYSLLGRNQQTGVNNQYQQGLNSLQNAQNAFNIQEQGGVRDLLAGKQNSADQIVQAAQQQLAYLDSQLINASLPDRVDIEAQKQQIRDKAMSALGQYDQSLTQGTAGITPATADQNRLKAQQLATAGTAPENQFSFTNQIPAQFQNTGPFASSLPIFTFPSAKKQTA